ncbi:MAG: tetratricopeptide repeat protein, partial [Candidatus Omnitrophota bacterium]
ALEAQFNVARLYMIKKDYEKARAYLKTMLSSYRELPGVLAETLFLIGNSYEAQDNWQAALEQYKKIEQDYPLTLRGMDIPIYIAIHYQIKYDPEKMVEAFRQAVIHYKQLAAEHPNTPLALNAEGLAAHCYVAMKEWQNAIRAFNAIIEKYKDKVNTDRIMFGVAMIYDQQLKNRTKAIETLQVLIKEYPKSPLLKPATEQLKKLEKDAASQGSKPAE